MSRLLEMLIMILRYGTMKCIIKLEVLELKHRIEMHLKKFMKRFRNLGLITSEDFLKWLDAGNYSNFSLLPQRV
jgi:hypothetical protein